jgi:hypothetical protein
MPWQIVSLYPIISFYNLNDSMVELNEFLGIAGDIILIDMPGHGFL